MNLNQITIPSLNVEKSADFYLALGLKIIVESFPRYVRFECPTGTSTFSIHLVDSLPEGNGITIYFEEDDLDYKVSELIEKGFVFDTLPEDKPWLWREANLKDPDRNNIILYYAGKNRKNPPWRIN